MAASCSKDNLYIAKIDDKISSMFVVSSDYSAGIPAIQMNDSYAYDYTHKFTATSGVLNSNFSVGVSDINIKVNPSNASLDNVTWSLVRRSATTKVMDSEEVYSGQIIITRSETATEFVTLSVDGSQNDFFDISQDYVYSVVATYEDLTEVSSDVACLAVGSTIQLQSIFMGQVIDGVVVDYSDNFKMTSNSMIIDEPVMYGVLPSGEVMTFEQMGIDESQYTLQSTESFAGATTATLAISAVDSDEDSESTTTAQWEVTVHDRLEGYNYNEFNGYIGIQYELYDSSSELIDILYSKIYTEMDDIELTKDTTISDDVSPFSFTVLCKNLDADYLDRILMLYPYAYEPYNDFVYYYCNDDTNSGLANTPKFYINDVESTEIILDYSDSSNIKITLNNPLSAGSYQIKVALSSRNYATQITETTTLTVL